MVRWIENGDPIVVPTIFLVEVAGAITRRTRDPAYRHRAIQALLEHPLIRLVEIDQILAELAAKLAVDVFLRGADAIYVALAVQRRLPLVTWDQEHLIRAASLVEVLSPANL